MPSSVIPYTNLGLLVFINIWAFYFKLIHGELFRNDCLKAEKICPNPNIKFFLYTSSQPDAAIELLVTDVQSISGAPFIEGPIKFLIHGYTGHKDYSPNKEVRPAYLQRESVPVNIISVDYGPLVKDGCYPQSVRNTDPVAMCIAQFLDDLLDIRSDIKLPDVHVVALSLGAQVAGQMRNYLKHGQIERISALDAALPLFYTSLTSEKFMINKGDAKFIDALHTNGGIKGKLVPYADADFFANGGSVQPGCATTDTSCSHGRSAELFAESINSPIGFLAHRCNYYTNILGYCDDDTNTWTLYGEYVDPEARGSFFFETNDQSPYAEPPEDEKAPPGDQKSP